MQNLDCSTVKHQLQNTQNDCHQWLSCSFRVHQIRFWPGLLASLRRDLLLKERGGERGMAGETAPLTQIPGHTTDYEHTMIDYRQYDWVRESTFNDQCAETAC